MINGNSIDWIPITREDSVLLVGDTDDTLFGVLRNKCNVFDFVSGSILEEQFSVDKKYNYVIFAGTVENDILKNKSLDNAEANISWAAGLLNEKGKLVIAFDNKYGLKYFAGCMAPNSANFYETLENENKLTQYGLNNILEKQGYIKRKYYYPYPDYQYAYSIFSDEYLPEVGELNLNIIKPGEDRMMLFDESTVFNNIIKDGKFTEFSNSYVVIASKDVDFDMNILYEKYSDDRCDDYKIRTEIIKDNGSRKVIKYAQSAEAVKHIKHMYEIGESLDSLLSEYGISLNHGVLYENRVELEYLDGENLTSRLDYYLHNNDKKMFECTIKDYCDRLRNAATEDFEISSEYTGVFGVEADTDTHQKSMKINDVDLIFDNIISIGNKWHVIDYEWTFDMLIPIDFILFRAAYYYRELGRATLLGDIDIYEVMSIPKEKIDIYKKMEDSFQHYISKGHIPMWEKVANSDAEVFYPAYRFNVEKNTKKVSVIKEYVNGEKKSEDIKNVKHNGEGIIEFDIDLQEQANLKMISIIPCHHYAIVDVIKLEGVSDSGGYNIRYGSNCRSDDNIRFVAVTDEPQIWTDDIRPGTVSIKAMMAVTLISSCVSKIEEDFVAAKDAKRNELQNEVFNLYDMIESQKKELDEKERMLSSKSEELQRKQKEIEEKDLAINECKQMVDRTNGQLALMSNSLSWRVTRPLRKFKGIFRRN